MRCHSALPKQLELHLSLVPQSACISNQLHTRLKFMLQAHPLNCHLKDLLHVSVPKLVRILLGRAFPHVSYPSFDLTKSNH